MIGDTATAPGAPGPIEAPLIVRAGDLEVRLLPAIGGCITRFDRLVGGRPQLLPRGADATITEVGDAAYFLLIPSPTASAAALFAAEPVQNANTALDAPQAESPAPGLTLLEQGLTCVLHARFDVVR